MSKSYKVLLTILIASTIVYTLTGSYLYDGAVSALINWTFAISDVPIMITGFIIPWLIIIPGLVFLIVCVWRFIPDLTKEEKINKLEKQLNKLKGK